MSQFTFGEYQNIIAKAQAGSNNNANSFTKVGFFKLKNDQDEALVRFNVNAVEDLCFATVHQLGAAQKYMKINCLAPFGSNGTETCPLCRKALDDTSIGKASKKVYVQMLVAYKDPATGGFSAAIPVIWERPAGFSKEIAAKLKNYGPLTDKVLKITRNGIAGARDTSYSLDYIPTFDTETLVPKDFSAFNNFDIEKHSYWVKTAEEIETFFETGEFPAPAKKANTQQATRQERLDSTFAALEQKQTAMPNVQATEQPYSMPIPGFTTSTVPPVTPSLEQSQPANIPVPTTTATEPIQTERPARKFNNGFHF